MKQRLITAGVGLVVFFAVMAFYNTVVFDILLCMVSLLIVHELLIATKVTKNIPLTITALLMSVVPFLFISSKNIQFRNFFVQALSPYLVIGAVAVMFLILLRYHEKLPFEKVAVAFFVSLVVPFSMSVVVQIRNEFDLITSVYYTLLVFACAWGSDSGAYFAGRFFGKRKLAPKISPKKTVEGVFGGVLSAILFVAGITACYYFYQQSVGVTVEIKWLYLLLISVVCSLVGVLGDLTASVIKRQTGIKDFGSIMPGHGGALDRFDSVLFVAPVLFCFLNFVPI